MQYIDPMGEEMIAEVEYGQVGGMSKGNGPYNPVGGFLKGLVATCVVGR